MKKLNKFIFAYIFGIYSCFSASSNKLDIQEKTLENGLRVIVANMKSKDSVIVGVGYFVGAGDDPRNVVGISHFLEHMMFKGTKNISGPKLKEVIGKYNKDTNAFTDYDITFYHHQCNKTFLDVDLKIEADRMQNLKMNKEDISKEKEVIIEERKMRMESDPRVKFMVESAYKSMFLYSKYSYPVIGYLDQIKEIDKKSLKKHYKKFYSPGNAFILFVGDITLNEAVEKVRKYFGAIPKGEKVERNRIMDPENTGLKYTIDHESDQVSMHNLDLMFKINKNFIDNIKKVMIVEIMTSILSKGYSSVLYQNIVDIKELAYTIDCYVDNRAFDDGRLSIATVFRENQNDSKIENEVNNIIYNFAEKYLTVNLFEREKRKIIDRFEIMEDNPKSMNMFIISNICNGYKIEEIQNIKNIVNSIKFEDIKNAAMKILTKNNRFIRIYGHPKEKI